MFWLISENNYVCLSVLFDKLDMIYNIHDLITKLFLKIWWIIYYFHPSCHSEMNVRNTTLNLQINKNTQPACHPH